MKEIVVLAGILGIVFMFFWCIITGLEFLTKKKKEIKRDARGQKDMVPVIVASIAAYEEEERRKKRGNYQKKEEGISWWKMSGRTK